jgi:hypothetical protein
MTPGFRRLAPFAILPLLATGCGGGPDDWRPLRAGGPLYSPSVERPAAGFGGSRLIVPRITGTPGPAAPLEEEPGDIWPARASPRMLPNDLQELLAPLPATATPRRSAGAPAGAPADLYEPSPFDPPPGRRAPRPGKVVPLPDGRAVIGGAGSTGAGTYTVPGRAGVGTALPDSQGGLILLEPGGRVLQAPR